MGKNDKSFNSPERRDSYNMLWLFRIGCYVDNEAQLCHLIKEPEASDLVLVLTVQTS